ncbi:TetR/AcrR family transcriptional regulator [Brachybacterium sacelli]|uniref:AcrR family transcriptional regulator n=1 Tax=Brachybacterium sacelli TaxID=173364 RepID=A0ABS4X1D7_9MICO|nr:TetR/AcrR family transcriptional regulator [Brachybacterium sacelli]MBP2382274.1 AcrR family transcriptional regulator [Brachybacterium sacelli]
MTVSDAVAPAGRRDKKRDILEAAAPVFGEQGYERASVEAIALAAGVSKPTVYTHFGSKEGLFRASVTDSARRLNEDSGEVIRQLVISERSWRRSLTKVAMALTACRRDDCARRLDRLVHAEVARDPEAVAAVRRAARAPLIEALAGRLAMLGSAGLLAIEDPIVAARQFLALTTAEVEDLTEMETVDVSEAALRRAVDRGVETFVRAYSAP